MPGRGNVPMLRLSWGDLGEERGATCHPAFLPKPSASPLQATPLTLPRDLCLPGDNWTTAIHLMPLARTVGGHMSHLWCLWHGGTWPSAQTDRSWVNRRRKMGINRQCRTGMEGSSVAPQGPGTVRATLGRFPLAFAQGLGTPVMTVPAQQCDQPH